MPRSCRKSHIVDTKSRPKFYGKIPGVIPGMQCYEQLSRYYENTRKREPTTTSEQPVNFFLFSSLPREIRDIIYIHAISPSPTFYINSAWESELLIQKHYRHDRDMYEVLLDVSRQIRSEVLPLLYRLGKFNFKLDPMHMGRLERFLLDVPTAYLRSITYLHIEGLLGIPPLGYQYKSIPEHHTQCAVLSQSQLASMIHKITENLSGLRRLSFQEFSIMMDETEVARPHNIPLEITLWKPLLDIILAMRKIEQVVFVLRTFTDNYEALKSLYPGSEEKIKLVSLR